MKFLSSAGLYWSNNIRIYHTCEAGIEKSIPRITDLHHKACQVMIIVDCDGWILISHSHTKNGFSFLLTT